MSNEIVVDSGITIWQPWAGLIAAGLKDVENRGWPSTFREWIAIHAGKTMDVNQYTRMRGGGEGRLAGDAIPWPTCEVHGAFIGAARVVDWAPKSDRIKAGKPVSWWHEDYQHGAYLEDMVAFAAPIPARGRQGIFRLSADERAAVGAAVNAAKSKRMEQKP